MPENRAVVAAFGELDQCCDILLDQSRMLEVALKLIPVLGITVYRTKCRYALEFQVVLLLTALHSISLYAW